MSSFGPVEIGYWGIRGLGAPLRLLCEYAGAAYTATLYDVTEKAEGGWDLSVWLEPKKALKAQNPLMNLPYIKDGDLLVTQSNACLVYLAEKYDLMGSTPVEKVRCHELLYEATDLRNAMVGKFYGGGDLGGLLSHSSLAKMEGAYVGPYALGAAPCAADFHVFELYDQLVVMAEFLKVDMPSYPKLAALHSAMFAEPKLADYFASPLHKLPINNKMAQFGAVPGGGVWVKGQELDWAAPAAIDRPAK